MPGLTVVYHVMTSASEHACDVINRCYAQPMAALRILRCHDMSGEALEVFYKAAVLSKPLYTCPVLGDDIASTNAVDRQRNKAFVRRRVRSGV